MNQTFASAIISLTLLIASTLGAQPDYLLQNLAQAPDYETHRASSYDKSGGNEDWISIEPGETKVLAEINGPGAITHIWNTVDGEKYYSRMLVLRFYWDGQENPSVEVPLGDFFGVGHGLNRAFQSLAVNASSEGRARNCYWYMPFGKSAKVTVTHEGFLPLQKFYYYIDYRKYASLPEDTLYFHAQYRQATPNEKVDIKGKNPDGVTNYVLMETEGKGKYVGSVVSVQMNGDGWFGEGDDMFFVDGADRPSLIGTGTEDYFNDAWGFREFSYPYHGVTLWEGYKKGDRGTAYKWHVFDPISFNTSLKATIEHGHANNRQDDWYSVAYWYQNLPSPKPPVLAGVFDRLPDEGQIYAQKMFLNKELALHIEQDRTDEALKRIDEFVKENPAADEFGYWSLRRAMLLKQKGELKESHFAFSEALQKSDVTEEIGGEGDASKIHALALKEYSVIDKKVSAIINASCVGSYEIYIDGKLAAKGSNWRAFKNHEVQLSRGKHAISVIVRNDAARKGLLLQISTRSGYAITDAGWKCSTKDMKDATDWMKTSFDDSKWSACEVVGTMGQGNWFSAQPDYYFESDIFSAKYIWAPEGAGTAPTTFFRKVIQVR